MYEYLGRELGLGQICQTLASVITLPVSMMSYISKQTSHYTSFHGQFGMLLVVLSLLQGYLGTIVHYHHSHIFGVHLTPTLEYGLRVVRKSTLDVFLCAL